MPRSWPPYQTLRPLIHRYVGRAAVVMGGGMSLDESMRRTPAAALHISVNGHGCRHFLRHPDPDRRCEYVVACDKIEPEVRPFGLPIVSRHMWADYRLLFMPRASSGMAAAWVARAFGCAPIILVGMDCYVGGTYMDRPDARSTGHSVPLSIHLKRWGELAEMFPAQYRALGGHKEVRKILGAYDPDEPARPAAVESIDLRGELLRTTAACTIAAREFPAGVELELMPREAKILADKGKGVRL